MRFSVAAACLSLSLIGFSSADDAHASIRKETNIPAEGLGPALNALAKDRNFQIVYVTEEIANVRTQGAVGDFTIEEALKRLLNGTGLTYRYLDDKTVTIGSATTPHERNDHVSQSTLSGSPDDANPKEGKKSSSDEFRLAQTSQGSAPSPSAVGGANQNQLSNQSSGPALTEIIVTAQKRNERLQDVPIPVTAIAADTLVTNNQLRIQDYYTNVPGLNVTPLAAGSYESLTIRGISTGTVENPTVGVTVDDVPYGTSTSNGGGGSGQLVPDMDPGDLARVEVLRGPQGTLYGAASMGGLLKYVTVDPSTDGISGRIEADTSGVYHGANLGSGVRGSINVPLSDTLAIRASAFGREDPGYIDNVETGQRGVNRDTAAGGRLAALWRPSELVSLKVGAVYQRMRGDGEPDVDKPVNGYTGPTLGNLQQYHIQDTGDYERTLQAYSAILNAKIGSAELTAISGYNVQQFSDSYDDGYIFNSIAPVGSTVANFGVTGDRSPENNKTNKYTEELRLSVPLGQRFDWLLGAFYTYEHSTYDQIVLAENPVSGAIAGTQLTDAFYATYMETAAFTDMTIHLTDQFNVQIGGRESQIRQTFSDAFGGSLSGLFFGADPFINPQLDSKANTFTYLVTPKFQISPDLMVYARFASGYRPGGGNYGAGPGVPGQYAPDKTENYEIGLKGEFLDHRFSVDASLYYIDWKNIQVAETNSLDIAYTGNGGSAKSQGLELSAESRPTTGLTIAGWIVLSDAELTQTFPLYSNAVGVSGDRLPYSSRFSANLSLDQKFPLSRRLTGFVGGTAAYVGPREGEFLATYQVGTGAERVSFPGYTKIDLRTGANYDSWTANLTVNNVTDQRGSLYGGLNSFPPFGFVYIQPRTVALSIVKKF